MGSFKRFGQGQGPDRRRGGKGRRGFPNVESLEGRTLLSITPWKPTSTDLANVKAGPMANEGATLIAVYQAYLNNGKNAAALATQFPTLNWNNGKVAIQANALDAASFSGLTAALKNVGMDVTSTSAPYGIVYGFVPVSALPTIAGMPQLLSVTPGYKPNANSVGVAVNQAQSALNAGTVTQQTGLDGTGVTVGVLSDSVSVFQGGLADSVRTGDLPSNVLNLKEGPTTGEDEGRAMLEQIHDIAPGSSLAFASAFVGGQTGFADSITALATQAKASVIVDDVNYLGEPFFQDGVISQAINNVTTNNNVTYLSSAINASTGNGYLSNFRGVQANVPGLGAGRYMNFAPSGTAVTQLPITTNTDGVIIGFQYDQPFKTQQPIGSTTDVTSDLDFYVLDAAGNIVAASTSNNLATHEPFEAVQIPSAGSYTVVVQVFSGPDPGHIEFTRFGNGPDNALAVSQQFGSAGGTYYPSSVGHNAAANTIGVGAVPWWAAPPFLGTNPLNSEGFSSAGPSMTVLNPDGTPKYAAGATVPITQNPVVSGTDGNNTSFFIPGFIIDTSNPPFPGQPATPTNLSQNLPSFFGTSSAAPNVAAVVALMKQRNPGLTSSQVRAGLIAGARPLNGQAAGTWNQQGGYGLVDAVSALAAVDVLRVSSSTPANFSTTATTPPSIVVTFSRPVDFSTIQANDLQFFAAPTGVSVSSIKTGTPIALDDPLHPTQIAFPFTFNVAPNTIANGSFVYAIKSPAGGPTVLSYEGPGKTGKPLQEYDATFRVNDTIAPRVTNTKINGRVVTVTFSEAMSSASINPSTVFLGYFNASNQLVSLNNDPRFKMTYDPFTSTATLDYSGLNQVQLPSARYALVVMGGNKIGTDAQGNPIYAPSVTDLVGNKLDGEFSGLFPSGDGDPKTPTNPTGRSADENFVQFLGQQNLGAPQVTSLRLINASDTGIVGDENTNTKNPVFVGQVAASFPGTVAGLTVYAEFSGLHGGNLSLQPLNGRGLDPNSVIDVQTTTDANGGFLIKAPFLPEGFQRVRLVVVGQVDSPPLAGLSSQYDHAFRVDNTAPQVVAATLTPGAAALPTGAGSGTPLASLSGLSLNVVDPASPATGPLATPPQVLFSALNPATAANVSNYELRNISTNTDYSRFIQSATYVSTGSNFVAGPNRTSASDPYFGRIDLTFAPGLVAGNYQLIVHTTETVGSIKYAGLQDTAGNPLDDTSVPNQGTKDFVLNLRIQPEPVYITSVSDNALNAAGNTLLPRSFYEINPRPGDNAFNPPTTFTIDVSNPLDPTTINADSVQLIRSANSQTSAADGEFGTLGIAGLTSTGTGFTRVNPAGTTVTLLNGPNGTNTRIILQLPAGYVLPADHYRFYMPNTGTTAIKDIYGNQLDGEFLGNQATVGIDANHNPIYESLMPTGQYRGSLPAGSSVNTVGVGDMSGDGVAGGAFMTGFSVVPSGNVIYARPDYVEDPLLSSTAPDGSLSRPYPVLAPQSYALDPNLPTNAKATLNNGDPNGGLNDASNFLTGFNPTYDRAGIGRFARSAFYAAAQLSSRGPVVIVALPGTPQRDPVTGKTVQQTFVLQAPSGTDPVANDGSGSVPFDTSLVFAAGSTLKLQNASLFVQNQGSSLSTLGDANPNNHVTFTSYANDTIGGDTNHDASNTVPRAGDWGGIVFRDFQQKNRSNTFPVDVTLTQGPNGLPAVNGQDDALSSVSFADITYGGGAVPATQGIRYDSITLYNARPAITQTSIYGGTGFGSQATISGDLNSFREDDTARGPLIRRTTVGGSSINGIWVRPLSNTGVAQPTDAVPIPNNPVTLGGVQNYTFDDPLPYVFTSVIDIGTQNSTTNPGTTTNIKDRLYVQPGMLLKFEPGAGLRALTAGASLIVGDRTYIRGWDALATVDPTNGLPISTYGPTDPNFKPNSTGDARVIFTSALDNTATTAYYDPITQQSTTIVPPIDSLNTGGAGQPTPGNVPSNSRWGRFQINSGVSGTIDEAEFRYGGGTQNVPGGNNGDPGVLQFTGAAGGSFQFIPGQGFVFSFTGFGTRMSVTNNNFFDNNDVPMSITPNGLLAADTLRPLTSGHPYFRGNLFQRNPGGNGLLVEGTNNGSRQVANVDVNSLWDATDLTYILRNSIVMGGGSSITAGFGGGFVTPPTSFQPEPKPTVVLTVQSAMPGTLLADGSTIPRPGQSVVVKLDPRFGQSAPSEAFTTTANVSMEDSAGPGFIGGVDNGVDPTSDPYFDVGVSSQMRFLGIGGNETTGQTRVPVIITSIHDNTVGTTVRGTKLYNAIDGDTTAPAAGDGGLIYFGGNQLPDYNVLDPRDGSLIDNADIRYISRIEMQGGGIVNYIDANASNSYDIADSPYSVKGGSFPPLPNGQPDPRSYTVQQNAANAMMLSDNNFANFRDAGVFIHPGFNQLVTGAGTRSGIAGQPVLLALMNNTFVNMPIAVNVIGDPNSNSSNAPSPFEVVALNNTFYNNPILIQANAIAYAPGTPQFTAQIHVILMDNIIDGSTTSVINGAGMLDGSMAEYNLYNNSPNFFTQIAGAAAVDVGIPNNHPTYGDPLFRDAANGNFQLQANSPAIDAARSELNLNPTTAPSPSGTGNVSAVLIPVVNQQLNPTTGIRNQNTQVSLNRGFGNGLQLDPNNPPTDFLGLTGSTDRGFVDQWFPTLPSDPKGIAGPTTVPGSWVYKPSLIPAGTAGVPGGGQRDALGFLRVDDPNKPNVGFGSLPFFDIGAFEYRQLFPPHVTNVTATVADSSSLTGTSTINFYSVGGNAGTNKPIETINVQFDHSLDPTTVNGQTVLLEASGGDGIFGNNNNANDKFYDLSGKVTFNSSTNILTINVGAAGLVLQSDKYRLFLLGSGSSVLKDPQGNILDGENTANNDPNGAQLALPSGDGFPGGTFYDTFIINTAAPSLVKGTFQLDSSSDSNISTDKITNVNTPSFSGNVAAPLSSIVPLAGQTVILDLSTGTNGVFDRLNAGTALTDSAGHFLVTVGVDGANTGLVTDTSPVPNSGYNVGKDGKLGTIDDSGYTLARIRVIDQSGNVSNTITDPISAFLNNGALAGAVIDTTSPRITSFSPAPNSTISPSPTTGKLTFSFTTDKNVDPSTLNANSILVNRAGPDGVLGTADDVSVPIDVSSISVTYLGNVAPTGGPKGPERISFTVSGSLPNDTYQVTLKGSGSSAITDIAGNALAGTYNGSFPSGQDGASGTDFNVKFVNYSSTNVHLLFVGAANSLTPDGTRNNPYPTIQSAIQAATAGDIVAVLPGVYTENVVMKPYIRLISADTSSTDSKLVQGNALQTIIRAPASTGAGTSNVTVTAATIPNVPGVMTEISGFTIASPLLGDPALGSIDPTTVGIAVDNAAIQIDRSYVVDSNMGILVSTHTNSDGTPTSTPIIINDGIIGNNYGIVLADSGATTMPLPTPIVNDTIAFNTIGILSISATNSLYVGAIFNNIFWQNHDLTTQRGGTGIFAVSPNKLLVRSNMFSGNGPNNTSPVDDAINVGGGLQPGQLKPTPDALGNYTGNPAFVSPRDPRPGAPGDGPAAFFLDASFDLQKNSAAIDTAANGVAPTVDFLGRTRNIRVAGHGFPGTGPADVGAFEYHGSGGVISTSSFVATSAALSTSTGISAASTTSSAPRAIDVSFSGAVNPSTVSATDLVLSGTGIDPLNPARATSLTWIDNHTVRFNLSGQFNSSGNVNVLIPAGAVSSTSNTPVSAFSETIALASTSTKPVNTTPVVTTPQTQLAASAALAVAPTTNLTPAPAPSPTTPTRRPFFARRLRKK